MSKVTVVGAGAVGATCANVMACREVASEVVLIDIKEGLSEGHASGLKEGLTQGGMRKLQELVEKKIQKGYAAEEIAEMLEEDIETIQKIIAEL